MGRSAYMRKDEWPPICKLRSGLKKLEKGEETNPGSNRRDDRVTIKAEINEITNGKPTEELSETKAWFFEKFNEIYKPLAKLMKKKKKLPTLKMPQGLSLQSTHIKRTVREYYKQLYTRKCDNSDETHQFLENYELPQLTQYETDYWITVYY